MTHDKIFFWIVFFPYFSLLCASVNFDFVLYYNLLLCFIELEMHVRSICAIEFYLLTYLLMLFKLR